ncbi:hypothetical protein ACLOJK_003584 [Asimina triloba]
MEGLDCSVSLSSLLCQEEACFDDDDDGGGVGDGEGDKEEENERFLAIDDVSVLESEDEYIEILVSRERSFGSQNYGSSDDCSTESWLKRARLEAVRWILKVGLLYFRHLSMRALFGFRFQTAYLSVTYLDRFLSVRAIEKGKDWAIRLLSVACLSLAAKMEECRVPALSEFPVEDYEFENKVIQRMELLVLNTLEWRMSSVTPFAYLNYFFTKFSEKSRPKALISKAVELILATTEVVNLVNHRPSTIAAAAVLLTSDKMLSKKSVGFEMGLEKHKLEMPKIVSSPETSSIYTSPVDLLDAASTSINGSKRLRLALSNYDEDKKRIN